MMKRTLFALFLSSLLMACDVVQLPDPPSVDAATDTQVQQGCAQPDSATCDEAARCVIVECTMDPYSLFAGACKDPTSDGCLKCARWARTTSLCHYLFERCNKGL